MATSFVQLDAVNTWYEQHGEGEAVVLLHPGGADARAFKPNVGAFAEHFAVFTPDRRGHGRTADVEGPISFDLMAHDTIAFLETVVDGPAHLVGYSDGATVALLVARLRPDLVRRVAFVASVFHHEGWIPGTLDGNDDMEQFLAENYGEVSPDGIDHFGTVLAKTNRMHAGEPTLTEADLANLATRTLVMVADDDEVTLEHAIALYRSLPEAELAVVPGTSHGLLVEKPSLCNALIVDFLTTDPTPTIAPIRRAKAR